MIRMSLERFLFNDDDRLVLMWSVQAWVFRIFN